jgi:hypothetical protein
MSRVRWYFVRIQSSFSCGLHSACANRATHIVGTIFRIRRSDWVDRAIDTISTTPTTWVCFELTLVEITVFLRELCFNISR